MLRKIPKERRAHEINLLPVPIVELLLLDCATPASENSVRLAFVYWEGKYLLSPPTANM